MLVHSHEGGRKREKTYCVSGELRRVVIDISDPDHSGGSVRQAVRGVSLHVSGLDDEGVVGDFL